MYNKERKTKYAIRKLAVATVSLAIGSVVAVPAITNVGQVAHAEDAAAKYQYGYHFVSGTRGFDVPDDIQRMAPVDNNKYVMGHTVYAKNPTQTRYEDKVNNGVWTFRGYDRNSITFGAITIGENFIGTWDFKQNNAEFEESYTYLSATPGKVLPDEIKNLKPVPRKYEKGARVLPRSSHAIYKTSDGVWLNVGIDYTKPYQRLSATIRTVKSAADVTYTEYWQFFRDDEIEVRGNSHIGKDLYYRRYHVSSETPGYELPKEIKDLYPSNLMYQGNAPHGEGTLFNPDNYFYPSKREYKYPTGTWSLPFKYQNNEERKDYIGWAHTDNNPNNDLFAHIVDRLVRWVFTPDNPSYTYVSGTTGKTLPQAITDLTPTDTNTYKKDDVVKAKVPGQLTYEDTVNNGTWTFKGYNKNSAIFGVDELKFEGVWTFQPKSSKLTDGITPNNPVVTVVDNSTQLTGDEKGKVEKAVKDANPTFPTGTTVTVEANGDVTITYPDNSTDTIPGIATVKERDISAAPAINQIDIDDTKITGTGVAGSKIEVTLPDGTTKKTTVVKPDGTWEVPLDNPLAKDGVVKATQEETDKKVSPIVPTTVVETTANYTLVNNPKITKVDNPTQLTQSEKDKVVDEVKKVNPSFPVGTTITVGNNGDVTITYPDTSTATIPGADTVAEKETSAKPTVDKVDTDDTKITGTGVAGSKIVVTLPNGDTKTTTVKPDGTWEVTLDNPLAKDGEVKVTQEETDKKVSPIAPTTVVPTTAEATTPNNPAVTKVDNPAQLTQDEKGKVEKAVKDANPTFPAGTTVTVDDNGDVTITYPDKSKDTIPGTSTVAEKETSAKPTVDKVDTDDLKVTGTGVAGSKIVVTLPNGDTKTTTVKLDGKWEVDLDNPLAKDGEVKVTQEETGKKVSPIAPTTVVPTTAEATTPNNPAVTKVDNPAQLTQDEKDKVVDEVKKANPSLPAGTTVTVDNNGDVTITYPDKSKDTIPGTSTVAEKETSAKPTVDKVDTDDLKVTGTGVAGSKIVVTLPNGDTKTTTVKLDGKWEVDLDNPLAKDGEVKVTQEETGKKVSPIAPTTVVPTTAEATTPNNPAVTKVDNPAQLTQDEKDKVVDEVKKANPSLPAGTTVTVGNNGDVTITYPDNSTDTIPGINTVVKKGHTPAPVVDKVDTDDTKITGEGVVGATVEVELPGGTKKTTVVKPDGKWEVPLDNPLEKDSVIKVTQTVPGKKVSEEVPAKVVETITDKIIPNKPAVTEVENRTQLTQEEKGKVEKAVKDANPTFPAGTTVTVDNNGEVTITYPDNSIDIIPGTKTVTEKGKVPGPAPKPTPTPTPGQKTIAEQITPKTPEVTEVGNKTKLTQGEKGKVEEAVKKANPDLPAGTKVAVADNGDVTITYPDGSIDTIPGESTVKEKVKSAGEKAKALPNTGLTANNAVVAGLSILAVAALLAARRKNNK